MELKFCMQDPTDPRTQYLYEAIVAAVDEALTWKGIYAFATRGGVDQLIEDPVVQSLMRRGGEIELIVGIDAITDRRVLLRLQELEAQYSNFYPRVFWNDTRSLFHPKLSRFGYEDGKQKIIVGSGNLTPGGLRGNFEAYTVVTVDSEAGLDVSSLDEFMSRHALNIRRIDQEALDRAAQNVIRPVAAVSGSRAAAGASRDQAAAPGAADSDRILIAQVPAAGGRWSQVHFNTDIVRTYFKVSDTKSERVFLNAVEGDGTRGPEEVRPVIFSQANRNHKIEIAAAKGLGYPEIPPLLIFRERGTRSFDYMLLMPGDPGYESINRLLHDLPAIGRGFRRSITEASRIAEVWPASPLLIDDGRPGAEL